MTSRSRKGSGLPIGMSSDNAGNITFEADLTVLGKINPATGGGTTKFLREDSTWAVPSGGGGGVSVTDGDKGHVIVSGSGSTWYLDFPPVNSFVAPVFSNITSKPTTLSGYGITDGITAAAAAAAYQPKDAELTAIAGLVPVTDSIMQVKAGAWTQRTPAQLAADLSATIAPAFANVTALPTTLSGYGITDGITAAAAAAAYQPIGGSVTASQISDGTAAGRAMVTAATAVQQTALLNNFTSAAKGLAPPSGGGTSAFLRADGSWAAPSGGGGGTLTDGDKGDILVSGAGATWEIDYATVNPVIAPAFANVTGKPTTLSGFGITDGITAAAAAAAYQPKDAELTAIAALVPTNNNFLQVKAGVWTQRTIANVLGDLNPTAAPVFANVTGKPTTLAGYGITDGITAAVASAAYQPLSADLTAIAALVPADDSIMQVKDGAWTQRTIAEVLFDFNATIAPSFASVTDKPNTLSGYGITDGITAVAAAAAYQPKDAELTAIAAITPVNNSFMQVKAGVWTQRTIAEVATDINATIAPTFVKVTGKPTTLAGYGITDGITAAAVAAAYQPISADLATIAAIAPANDSFMQVKDGDWTQRTVAQAASDLNAVIAPAWSNITAKPVTFDGLGITDRIFPFIVPSAGEYFMPTNGSSGNLVTLPLVADRIDLFMWYCPRTVTISQITANCTIAVAGGLGKFVAYDSDSNDKHKNLLFETATVDLSTIGQKDRAQSFTFVGGKVYWIGFRASAVATMSSFLIESLPDINGGTAISLLTRKLMRKPLTFATAAPSVLAWNSAEIVNNNVIAIWLRT